MSREFRLPDVGEGIHEAEVTRWLVQEGQRIQEFEPMVEVQTDKALVELPSPVSGYIAEILTPAGTLARVGEVLVRFATKEQMAKEKEPKAESVSVSVSREQQQEGFDANPRTHGHTAEWTAHRPLATPGVRYYARQKGVPLGIIKGTGPRGRIRKEDIDAWFSARDNDLAEEAQSTHQHRDRTSGQQVRHETNRSVNASTRVPFRGLRRATAEHVKKSAFTAPHVTAFDNCDATELVLLRNRWNSRIKDSGARISYLPFLIKATVSALSAFPYFNARLDEEAEEIELIPEIHVGIAVDTPEGLLVPVIRDADQLTIREIAEEIQRLSAGAKSRSLKTEELRGSTFTITNMGPIGGLFATPILNYPEVGILAVHQIQRKPVVIGDDIVIREVLTLSLSFDHRVIDGATSVRFMNHIKELIEHPETLMLDMR